MNKIKYLFLLGAIIMALSIIYGFVIGDFTGEGKVLLDLIWGKITMIDIYIAFLTFAGWMFYREGFNLKSIIIFLGILVLGSFTICFYTYLVMEASKGDWQKFWLGEKRR